MHAANIHVLMTGAGAPGAAGIIKCLQQENYVRLTVADANPDATGRYLIKDFVCIPKGDAPDFAQELLRICIQRKVNVLMPLVTRELTALSKQKKNFEKEGIRVLVSSEESIERANNKSATYRFLKEHGIAVPKFFVVHTIDQFIHAAFELGHPQKPFCFKPSFSNGSRGVRIVNDAIDQSTQLFDEKPYQLHMAYAQALSILSSRPFPELLLSEYLPGEEYSVDCIAFHGQSKLIVPRLRKKMINGISVEGILIEDQVIIDYCKRVIDVLKLHGNVGIQLKMSEQNKPLLLEINPRVQGTIVAALGAGVNLPLLAIKQELGIPINEDEMKVRWGTGFSRYWTEVFY
ncbi:MAG: ATP-grasp domain-containing protein [Flavisolibacter sp.]